MSLGRCLAPMADPIFYFKGQLSHCLTQLGKVEDGVIAKAPFTPRLKCYDALAFARKKLELTIRYSYGNNTPKACLTLFPGYLLEL